jgi:uncharacterized protein (TIGR02001 family)
MQRIFSQTLMLLALLAFSITSVQAAVTANVGVTSNYVFRGETQTDDGAAIQGGVDFSHEVGFYLGAWASNVDFPGANADGFEVDLYGGIKFNIGNNMALDVGYISYQYTDSNLNDVSEIYFGFIFNELSITYFDGDVDNTNNDYNYIDVKFSPSLPYDMKLLLHYGYKDNEGSSNVDDASIGISKDFGAFEGSATFTTIDGTGNDDEKFFLMITKSFDI